MLGFTPLASSPLAANAGAKWRNAAVAVIATATAVAAATSVRVASATAAAVATTSANTTRARLAIAATAASAAVSADTLRRQIRSAVDRVVFVARRPEARVVVSISNVSPDGVEEIYSC